MRVGTQKKKRQERKKSRVDSKDAEAAFFEELGPNVKISDPAPWRLRQKYHKIQGQPGQHSISKKDKRTLEARTPVSDTAWFAALRTGLFGDAVKTRNKVASGTKLMRQASSKPCKESS